VDDPRLRISSCGALLWQAERLEDLLGIDAASELVMGCSVLGSR
jgi:hypothetical protein